MKEDEDGMTSTGAPWTGLVYGPQFQRASNYNVTLLLLTVPNPAVNIGNYTGNRHFQRFVEIQNIFDIDQIFAAA